MPLDVSTLDFKTSHEIFVFPGLVNVSAFVPRLLSEPSNFSEMTRASVSAGFPSTLILPFGSDKQVHDSTILDLTHSNAIGLSHCNYGVRAIASSTNVQSLDDELRASCKALYIPYSDKFGAKSMSQQTASVAAHFASWPADNPIITDAKASDLSSVLLLASLHGRSVHITDLPSRDGLLLVSLSRDMFPVQLAFRLLTIRRRYRMDSSALMLSLLALCYMKLPLSWDRTYLLLRALKKLFLCY